MKANWIDILKAKLDQREFKASQQDWSAMESLLDQSFPVDSTPKASSVLWKANILRLGLFVALLVVPSEEPLIHTDNYSAEMVQSSILEDLESTDPMESEAEVEGLEPFVEEPITILSESTNESPNESLNEIKIAAEIDQATIVSNPNEELESPTEPLVNTVSRAENPSHSNTLGTKTAENNISFVTSSNQKSSVVQTVEEKADEFPMHEEMLETQKSLNLNELKLFLSEKNSITSGSNLIPPSPTPLLYSSTNRSVWNKWDALNLQILSDFNSTSEISLSAERAAWGGRFGFGIGFGKTQLDYSIQQNESVLELTQTDAWLVETTTEIQIDSTWRILGVNQGTWQVDTFYNVRIDSSLVTSTDSTWKETTVNINRNLSSRFIELPFYYEKSWTKARWSLVTGIGGGLGWMNLTENTADLGFKNQDFIRVNTEFRLGLDYALHRDWMVGVRYRPRYIWYSDDVFDSNWQLNHLSLGLKFYFR